MIQMSEEIKETLEYKIDFLTKSLNIGIPTKSRRYFNDIKDYITKLQQENEKLLNENIVIKDIKYMVDEAIYKSRCEKAIEYIKNNWYSKKYNRY